MLRTIVKIFQQPIIPILFCFVWVGVFSNRSFAENYTVDDIIKILKDRQQEIKSVQYSADLTTTTLPRFKEYDTAEKFVIEDLKRTYMNNVEKTNVRKPFNPNDPAIKKLIENKVDYYLHGSTEKEITYDYIIEGVKNIIIFVSKSSELIQIRALFDDFETNLMLQSKVFVNQYNSLSIKNRSHYLRSMTPLFNYEMILDNLDYLECRIKNNDENSISILGQGIKGTPAENIQYEIILKKKTFLPQQIIRNFSITQKSLISTIVVSFDSYQIIGNNFLIPTIVNYHETKQVEESKELEIKLVYEIRDVIINNLLPEKIDFKVPKNTMIRYFAGDTIEDKVNEDGSIFISELLDPLR